MTCLFPIFLECNEWTLDPYWHEIFTQCSLGKFPKGMKIKNNSIIVSLKDKEIFSLEGNSLDVFKTMMNIFKNKLNLISDRDIHSQKKDIEDLKETLRDTYDGTWKQIRPKKIKDILLLNYVIECKYKHNLTKEQANKLYSRIKLSFIFKTITSDDVEYSDGVIHNINGIDIYDNNFLLDSDLIEEDKYDKNLLEINKPYQYVEKYIRDYKLNVIEL